jgi:hypothetical protein
MRRCPTGRIWVALLQCRVKVPHQKVLLKEVDLSGSHGSTLTERI